MTLQRNNKIGWHNNKANKDVVEWAFEKIPGNKN